MSVSGAHHGGADSGALGGTSVVGAFGGGMRASVAASLAGKAAEMVTLLLLATLVPRVLGPHDYGRFAVPLTVVTIGSLALTLGGPTLMARFVPAARPDERLALARALGTRLARGRAAQLAVLGAVALAAVVWDPGRFPPLATALVSVALVLNVAASLALQVTLGLGRTGAWSMRYPLQNAVLIVAVLALHAAAGHTGTLAALVVAAVVAAGLGLIVAAPVLRARPLPVVVPEGAIRFGAFQAAGAALVQVAHRGGVLAVAVLAGSAVETGYAALAGGIALGLTYAVLQAFTVSLPHLAGSTEGPSGPGGAAGPDAPPPSAGDLSTTTGTAAGLRARAHVTDEARAAEAVLRRLAGGLLVVLVPAAVLAALVLDTAVPVVFGTGFEGATPAFRPVLALVVLAPLYALTVQSAALRLRPEAALASGCATALAFVVVAMVAVPAGGASGATAAALAGAVAGAVVSLRLLPGAVGGRLAGASLAGAAAVLALAVVV